MAFHASVPALAADGVVALLLLSAIGCSGVLGPSTSKTNKTLRPPLGQPKSPRIVVEKSARVLRVYDGQRLVKTYRCCTGTAGGDKEREGDRKTPLGDFFVCYKNPKSKYTLSLGLSYPLEEDADRGLAGGLITQRQHDAIVAANRQRSFGEETWDPLWKTSLGGEIMIHGAGADRVGTAGCVGLDDDDIRELYAVIPEGTPVTLLP